MTFGCLWLVSWILLRGLASDAHLLEEKTCARLAWLVMFIAFLMTFISFSLGSSPTLWSGAEAI
jgi:hypothetical protein